MKDLAISNPALQPFTFLIGRWSTVGRHPYLPGVTLHGEARFEWVEGGAFLRMRTEMDDARIPAGTAIFGSDDATGQLFMLYFDVRGVSRKYNVVLHDQVLTWSRDTAEFSQRFTISVTDDSRRMVGKGEMSKDGAAWEPDLHVDYTREA